MHPYDVLLRPLLSEKSNEVREKEGKYSFQVRIDATKRDVKRAIEKLYDVPVEGVQTLITRGKIRRRGQYLSKRPGKSKKAVVTLGEGAKIPLFDDL